MKPIAIFRHSATEGPGYFATFLDENRIPWRLFCMDAGDAVPADPGLFSGLGFMGGAMSVNDPLPWIPQLLELIQTAVERDIPVIGHCLGGQLISKALGGTVTANPIREIGWHKIQLANNLAARDWFGDRSTASVFQWHSETFSLPFPAVHIAESEYCRNQIFVLGKHLGMQCHIEMTRELVESWCAEGAHEIEQNYAPAVQSISEILSDLNTHIANLNQLASGIYRRWISGIPVMS
jgi:GMP synthase-like glutamine amidotransferase